MTLQHVENTNGNTPAVPAPQQPPMAKAPVPLGAPLSDLDQAWRLAGALMQSYLLPASLTKNPKATQANVTLILLYGAELGLAPMQSIQEIYVVNGRPQLSGRLWLAKVRSAGHKVEKVVHTAQECTIRITRGDTGEDWEETFTIDDARLAGLLGKDTYKQHPKRMLLWRAVANCATGICPEVAMGFGSELPDEDAPPPPPEVSLARAVDARTTPAAQPPAEDIADGEIVDDTPDEALREEILGIANAHTSGSADGGPLTCTICMGPHDESDCPDGGA
ncbi:hypothetical protein [Herbidospora daliensis]|uniref:hypothetical protein n=1 Tax=Herbidospora daliensis TaxID=295585 RepID=UPI0007827B36|nr:hypothetical protein [Herbidospora daliensis]